MTLPTVKAVKNWKGKIEKDETEEETNPETDSFQLILKASDPEFKFSLTKNKETNKCQLNNINDENFFTSTFAIFITLNNWLIVIVFDRLIF